MSILISFAPKIIPEHRTNHIWNISEARLEAPNSQKVILNLRVTFFVTTHGRKELQMMQVGIWEGADSWDFYRNLKNYRRIYRETAESGSFQGNLPA